MEILKWFTGGDFNYQPLVHCMDGDGFWMSFFIAVKIGVLIPYAIIAWIWWRNSKITKGYNSSAALNHLMWIFILCGISGYGFALVDLFWPAKRLEILMHIPLIIFSFLFVLKTRYIKIWYTDQNRMASLRNKLQKTEWENDKLVNLMQDQEKSLKESSKALHLISKTRKEIKNGEHDDSM